MVRLNRIYTRTGDDGTTGLVDGSRRSKADALFEAIGDVDELNCAIGGAALHAGDDLLAGLRRIQNDLFDLGADLATPFEEAAPSPTALRIVPTQVERLEHELDGLNDPLPPLRSFILPGGTPAATALHVARALARRAERSAIRAGAAMSLNPQALIYLNRLSDYLFVVSRVANRGDDVLWVPGGSR